MDTVVQKANTANPEQTRDYTMDGLRYCGICHTPKQCRQQLLGKERIVPCMCSCSQENYDKEQHEKHMREEFDRITSLRNSGIHSQILRNATFTEDDGKNPAPMTTLLEYAQQWTNMEQENIGLLLYGDVGTGKSYGAACIANYLIEQHIPACMINLSTVLNSLSGFNGDDKNIFIKNLMQHPLLILDDFGMERQTEYALEQVFNVVDARYRSGKPLIVTTNLSLVELNNPQTIEHKRIYDRIMEMCQPVNFGCNGRRTDYALEKMRKAAKLLHND